MSPDLFVDTGPDDALDAFRSCTPGAKKSLMSPRLSATLSGRPVVAKRERTYSASGTKNQTVLRTQQRNIYIAGRPPWYDAQGQQYVEPFVIGTFAAITSFGSNVDAGSNVDTSSNFDTFI